MNDRMDDLVQWLRAQLDDDERIAREAAMAIGRTGYEGGVLVDPPARWGDDLVADGAQWVPSYHLVKRERRIEGEKARTVADCGGFGALPVAVHVAHHDPAGVLREIDAKRRMLSEHAPSRPKGRPSMERHCQSCTTPQAWDDTANEANCLTLRLIALPYADRPGYRQEWAP